MPRGEFFDYDPITGVAEYLEETADGKVHVHSYQDVTRFKDAAQRIRNAGTADDAWKKQEATMYATLPMIVVHEMLKNGINVFDQNDMPRVIKEINTKYPDLKTTYKHHQI